MKVTPEDLVKNIDDALQEAWKVEDNCLPRFIVVSDRLGNYLITERCPSKKKRQRKKWAKSHGFKRIKECDWE